MKPFPNPHAAAFLHRPGDAGELLRGSPRLCQRRLRGLHRGATLRLRGGGLLEDVAIPGDIPWLMMVDIRLIHG